MTDDDCTCEFDYPEPDGEESWHYSRTCRMCSTTWGALHCPHDGIQRACPECRWIDPDPRTPFHLLAGLPWTES